MAGGKVCLPVKTLEANQPVAAHQGVHHCYNAALTLLLSRSFEGQLLQGMYWLPFTTNETALLVICPSNRSICCCCIVIIISIIIIVVVFVNSIGVCCRPFLGWSLGQPSCL